VKALRIEKPCILAFVAVGYNAKPYTKNALQISPSCGWKYGFKSIKSINHIGFNRQKTANYLESTRLKSNTAFPPTFNPQVESSEMGVSQRKTYY